MSRENPDTNARRASSSHLFLGGLTAGESQVAPLPEGLDELMDSAVELLGEYRSRTIDATALAESLSRLRAVDDQGDEWTVGASTLAWYRRTPGLPWTRVDRPGSDVVVSLRAPRYSALRGGTAPVTPDQAQELDGVVPEDPGAQEMAPLAVSGPWAQLPVTHEEQPEELRAVPDGPWQGAAQPSGPVDSPPTVPLEGPFATLPPRPARADGPLTGTGLDGDSGDGTGPA
jgi:hypothetical protein